ncbi:MAG: hypothetical protein Q9183_006468, partial [Haloplaca sp. 2 TL-2023]
GPIPPHFWTDSNSMANVHPEFDLNRQQYLDAFDLTNLRNAIPRVISPTALNTDGTSSWQSRLQPRVQHFHPYLDRRSQAARDNVLPVPQGPRTEEEMELLKGWLEYNRQSAKDRNAGQ